MATAQLRPARAPGVDRVVLVFAAALIVLGAASADTGPEGRGLDGVAALLLVAGAAAVVAGGRVPGAAAVAAIAVTLTWYGVGFESGLVNATTMAAFYRLGASEGQRRKVVVTAGAVGLTAMAMLVVGDETFAATATAAGYLVMAVLVGELFRSRHLLVERWVERAARAEADAERRLAEERMAIARDVHDVLAHSVSVMTVQAAVAADSLERDRDRAAASIAAVRAEGRRAMDEVRAIVAVLRSPPGPFSDPGRAPVVPCAPAPRLDNLDELAAAARRHGLSVSVELAPGGGALPDLVELTAFRVVQESLTNAVRHGVGASEVAVAIRRVGTHLDVEVRDDGEARGPVEPGFGLRGMAERVEAIGATLHHGIDPRGGFVVRTSLPLGERTGDGDPERPS